jgi:hypothetical protein
MKTLPALLLVTNLGLITQIFPVVVFDVLPRHNSLGMLAAEILGLIIIYRGKVMQNNARWMSNPHLLVTRTENQFEEFLSRLLVMKYQLGVSEIGDAAQPKLQVTRLAPRAKQRAKKCVISC